LFSDQLIFHTVNNPANWISIPLLELIGFGFHHYLQHLMCVVCKKSWSPSSALKHALTHNGILKIKTLQHEFNRFVQEYNIPEKPTLLYPTSDQAPVNGLDIFKDGFSCLASKCHYACPGLDTMKTHWRRDHNDLLFEFDQSKRYRSADIQCYYANTSNKYWSVDRSLADRSPDNLYHIFRTQFRPSMETGDYIDPPKCSRDIPPWLRVSDFHGYLGDHLLNKEKCVKLVGAASPPRSGDAEYGQLRDWVFEYMMDLRPIAKLKVPYTIMMWLYSMDPE
jgi:hypothetical protein